MVSEHKGRTSFEGVRVRDAEENIWEEAIGYWIELLSGKLHKFCPSSDIVTAVTSSTITCLLLGLI